MDSSSSSSAWESKNKQPTSQGEAGTLRHRVRFLGIAWYASKDPDQSQLILYWRAHIDERMK